jgi:adenylate cyclase
VARPSTWIIRRVIALAWPKTSADHDLPLGRLGSAMLRLDTDFRRFFRTRFPLSVSIGTLVSLLVSIVGGSLVAFDQYQARSFAIAQANESFETVGRAIGLEVVNVLAPIEVVVNGTVAYFERIEPSLTVSTESLSYLAQRLRTTPHLYSLYVADSDGNFAMVSTVGQGKDALYDGWLIRRGPRGQFWQWVFKVDRQGRAIDVDTRYNNGFDPRLRGWYHMAVQAEGIVQTPPYLFYAVSEIGLTLARHVPGRHGTVVGGDVTLGSLGQALTVHRRSENFHAIMFESDGDILASDQADWVIEVDKGDGRASVRRLTLATAGSPIVSALSKLVATGFEQGLTEVKTIDMGEWTVWLRNVSVGSFEGRRLAVMVPSSELFATVNRNAAVGLAIAFAGILGGLFFAWRLGRSVARPVEILTGDAARLTQFDLSDRPYIRSIIREIIDLDRAVHAMRAALRNFSVYVPSQLVRLLVTGRLTSEIRGDRQEITLLFTDVEGFTTISEMADPIELTRAMSQYLGALSHSLIDDGATVDKFIGDAVMAFWNAPEEQPGHAAIACYAALRAKDAVARFNRARRETGQPIFHTRFGLHTGSAVVGTIGSEERANYTALGAVVNLAARLEGMNKIFGTTILISQPVREELDDRFVCRSVDLIMAKGTLNAVRIYELIGMIGGEPELNATEDGVAMARAWVDVDEILRARDWFRAVEALDEHLRRWPHDGVADEMLRRATNYIMEPPPDDWDGVERLHSK